MSVVDELVGQLRTDIRDGRIPPETRLVEARLVSRYGVARSTVRSALQQLTFEGLIEVVPNSGARVRRITAQDVRDTFAVLEMLAGVAARSAAEHATADDRRRLLEVVAEVEDLHARGVWHPFVDESRVQHTVRGISGNPVLERVVAALRLPRLRGAMHGSAAEAQEAELIALQREATDAIVEGDADAAEAAMRAHIGLAGTLFAELVERGFGAGSAAPDAVEG